MPRSGSAGPAKWGGTTEALVPCGREPFTLGEGRVIREAIVKLAAGGSLDQSEAAAAMEEIMAGEATPAQIAAFATALRFKGETIDEIAGLARVMRLRALNVSTPHPVVDTCGTGADESGSIN